MGSIVLKGAGEEGVYRWELDYAANMKRGEHWRGSSCAVIFEVIFLMA